MMKRDECLKILAQQHTDEIVVAVYQAAFEWRVIKPDALTYVAVGAMGQASSHALGLALGRPDKRIIVLDGDGSLLMNLGSLVTIASVAPVNLIHFVCANGVYEANGSHPIPGDGRVDLSAVACAAGYRATYSIDDLHVFEQKVGDILQQAGPVFVALHVEQGEAYPQDYGWIHSADERARFKRALKDG